MISIAVDIGKCLHCRSCELACALSHSEGKSLAEALGSSPLRRIRLRPYGGTWAPIACQHCEDAPCVYACIAGIRQRTAEGIRTEEGECVGCGTCYMICPSGAITRDAASGRYASCDRCGDGDPHCVRACPTAALRVVETEAGTAAFFQLTDRDSEVLR